MKNKASTPVTQLLKTAETAEDVLRRFVKPDKLAEATASIRCVVDRMAERRALLISLRILAKVGSVMATRKHIAKIPSVKAFCRLFAPVPGRSLADDAKALGVKKQALHYHETEFRRLLEPALAAALDNSNKLDRKLAASAKSVDKQAENLFKLLAVNSAIRNSNELVS
jgi:hypothetical protein